ncbi:conserved exported hypothetical protein [Paraburkholderia ribeironis]|uniref:MxaA protein n=1 Tax=Paraburkholderia ribeironis TaxID=1247936 RepID=A0A1N7S9W7_9BURK|nr:calcium incorporation protein MxaA [Paraburkholderia ribeironis]SIT43768.1 conserved exported hypothetical protein [Paraburkholderia ribeironis]
MTIPLHLRRLLCSANLGKIVAVFLIPALVQIAAISSRAATTPPAIDTVPATVEEPRGFGYVLGDVVTQRVLLEAGGHALEPGALPPLKRTGAWLERRAARVETNANGEQWVVLEYQIINAPPTLSVITLPALTLPVRSGPALSVPEWPLSVAALTPPTVFGKGDMLELRPDHGATLLPTLSLRRQLAGSLAVLAAILLAWLAWWVLRNRHDAAHLPFAQAWRKLRSFNANEVAHQPEAWVHMHRALNDTAGQVIHAGLLHRLFRRAPHLRPLQQQLESFYAHSGQRFFGRSATDAHYPLLDLCRALRRAERRERR